MANALVIPSSQSLCGHHPHHLLTTITHTSFFVNSQGRDGTIKVWEAERLVCDRRTQPPVQRDTDGMKSKAPSPAPLRTLTTGAFHFCQFALTRWRETPQRRPQRGGLMQQNDDVRRGGQHRRGLDGTETYVDDTRGDEHHGQGESMENSVQEPHRVDYQEARENLGIDQQDEKEGSDAGGGLSNGSFDANVLLTPCDDQHAVRAVPRLHRPKEPAVNCRCSNVPRS